MKYYIKKRHNPQFDKPYYTGCGQLSAKDAKRMENPSYGTNYMIGFKTKKEYENKLAELKKG